LDHRDSYEISEALSAKDQGMHILRYSVIQRKISDKCYVHISLHTNMLHLWFHQTRRFYNIIVKLILTLY